MVEPSPPALGSGVDDDYSASKTLIHFPHAVPLLRGPIPAGPSDDPSRGPYVLAFRDPESFHTVKQFCELKLQSQCKEGSLIGCSIAASKKCKPSWWKLLLGGRGVEDFKEREICEEREMVACVEESKGKCLEFAKERSVAAFGSARVKVARELRVKDREAKMLIGWVAVAKEEGVVAMKTLARLSELRFFDCGSIVEEVNYIRGSELMGGG